MVASAVATLVSADAFLDSSVMELAMRSASARSRSVAASAPATLASTDRTDPSEGTMNRPVASEAAWEAEGQRGSLDGNRDGNDGNRQHPDTAVNNQVLSYVLT